MNNKHNQKLKFDREEIALCDTYASTVLKQVEEVQARIEADVQFLNDENNLTGKDAVPVQQGLRALKSTVDLIQKKMASVSKGIREISMAYGNTAKAAAPSLAQAREALVKNSVKVRETKN